jgi:hypothetical protein
MLSPYKMQGIVKSKYKNSCKNNKAVPETGTDENIFILKGQFQKN